MSGLRLDHPALLLMLLLVPAAMFWRRWRGRAPVLVVPYAAAWSGGGDDRSRWRIAPLYAAIALGTVALARPQMVDSIQEVEQHGYDLMLAVDLSTSMLSEDYAGPHGPINRLESIRPVIQAFIQRRPNDRIGIVVFARRAMTLAPLTTDHAFLAKRVAALRTGLIDDGTAIGDGLGIALADLDAGRDEAQSAADASAGAFVVLLTDGSNNSGELTPGEAAAVARHRRVPVYAVGTGRNGMVPFPVFDGAGRRVGTSPQPSALDIDALRTVAGETAGRFFMAGDSTALQAAFRAIDNARKAEFHVRRLVRVRELFAWCALPAFVLLLLALPGLGRSRPAPHLRGQPA